MKEIKKATLVNDIMKPIIICNPEDSLEHAAQLIHKNQINHLPVVSDDKLVGIVTSWDIAKALATGKNKLKEVMTTGVVTVEFGDKIDVAAIKLHKHKISALPVVDRTNKIRGIITSEDISKLMTIE